jgi:hypothetical protein
MTRQAPQAVYNDYALHKFADAGQLLWIGGPVGAYDRARRFLAYSPRELRRVPMESAFRALQGARRGGVAFVFRPHSDAASCDFHSYIEVVDMAAHKQWATLDAAAFLEIVDMNESRPARGKA